jgi:hypothetical protein
MDPCVPGVSLEDARASARAKLGVPQKYASKMSVESICRAFKFCKKTNIMPPMDYQKFNGKYYLIDPKSRELNISIKDFLAVLGPGKIEDVQKIAKKLELMTNGISKSELKTHIIKILQTFNISEPIEIPSQKVRVSPTHGNLGNSGNIGSGNIGSGNIGSGNIGSGNLGNSGNIGSGNLGNSGNGNLGPESGETPYSGEVAPNYFKLKPHPSKIKINTPYNNENEYIRRLLKPSHTNENEYIRRLLKPSHNTTLKPHPSKINIKPVTKEQINESIRQIKNLKKMISGNQKVSEGTQTI